MVSGATQSFANEGERGDGEKERVERQKVAEKDGESMNGSLGILQRQRGEKCPFRGLPHLTSAQRGEWGFKKMKNLWTNSTEMD